MPNHVRDLMGKRFGRLVVIGRAENSKQRSAVWVCKCDCGNITEKRGSVLVRGGATSCGCYSKEVSSKLHKTHGMSNTRLYKEWRSIKDRCASEDPKKKRNYRDRGVLVCDEWLNDFSAFSKWALENGYSDELTIDRIDNDEGYSPENCRWATTKQQQNNKRTNRVYEYRGEKYTISELSEMIQMDYGLLRDRIVRYGWDVERAVNTPRRKR